MNRVGNMAKVMICFAALGLVGEAGAQEVLEQWVLAVVEASSRPSTSAGSDDRITGSPDSACRTGDFNFDFNSWRTLEPDGGVEWIAVRFAQPVYAFTIEVHEGFNPGAVVAVQVLDEEGKWLSVWEDQDPTRDCPGVLKVNFPTFPFPVSVLRIEMNTSLIPGWNQLDAVQLVGFRVESLELLFEAVAAEKIFKQEEGEEEPSTLKSYTFGDYDNDGWPDLFSATPGYPGRIFMLHNEGDGTYGNRAEELPIPNIISNAGRLFGDYDNDGDADLFIAYGSVIKNFYGKDVLLRNDGRKYTDISTESGLSDSLVSATAMYWDYDRDGWLDLYVGHGTLNDTTIAEGGSSTNSLYRNNGSGTFSDVEVFIEQATTLGDHWINLSRNIVVEGDPNTAVTESFDAALPPSFTLDQNYPNPFNSDTVIRFALPTDTDVELTVYNLTGQQVATLVQGEREAGAYTVYWDGRDNDGRELASGVYLYRLRTGDGQQMETRKLLLLR